jgi:hypothetical protein
MSFISVPPHVHTWWRPPKKLLKEKISKSEADLNDCHFRTPSGPGCWKSELHVDSRKPSALWFCQVCKGHWDRTDTRFHMVVPASLADPKWEDQPLPGRKPLLSCEAGKRLLEMAQRATSTCFLPGASCPPPPSWGPVSVLCIWTQICLAAWCWPTYSEHFSLFLENNASKENCSYSLSSSGSTPGALSHTSHTATPVLRTAPRGEVGFIIPI